jgi:hypothetical protein
VKRGWWLVLALLAGLAVALGWWHQRPFDVLLPVVNRSDDTAQLLLYGAGLSAEVLIDRLVASDTQVVTLHLAGDGPVRIKAETRRAKLDAVLLQSTASLRRQPLQLEIRPGNQFVLEPRL